MVGTIGHLEAPTIKPMWMPELQDLDGGKNVE